jgi:hypothetical protein
MPNRRLTREEAAKADELLNRVKEQVRDAAGGDPVLLFALRRRLYARLMYWERGAPGERTKLKKEKWQTQNGLCAICDQALELKGSELDRADPVLGYTASNTRLVHHTCHRTDQEAKGFR